jgi:hypothetical protein
MIRCKSFIGIWTILSILHVINPCIGFCDLSYWIDSDAGFMQEQIQPFSHVLINSIVSEKGYIP